MKIIAKAAISGGRTAVVSMAPSHSGKHDFFMIVRLVELVSGMKVDDYKSERQEGVTVLHELGKVDCRNTGPSSGFTRTLYRAKALLADLVKRDSEAHLIEQKPAASEVSLEARA